MNDRMRRSFDRFKGPFDNMLSRLCQNLDRYILRDHILLDQCTQKLIFCLRRCRKSHFDLLEADIQKHLEEGGFEDVGGEFTYIANDLKDVEPAHRETIDKMVERLEEFDDVQTVYTNMKPEESEE